jgi:hypothetical protein
MENHHMRLRNPIIFGIIVLVLAGGFLYARGTPRYSIYLLTRALNNYDADEALRYIDVDSIAEGLAKSIFVDGSGQRKVSRDVSAAVSMNMPSIKEGMRTYLASVIRSKEPFGDAKQREALGLSDFDIHNIGAFTIWGLDIETRGKTARVKLKGKSGQSVQMARTDEGYWKIIGVNLSKTGKE